MLPQLHTCRRQYLHWIKGQENDGWQWSIVSFYITCAHCILWWKISWSFWCNCMVFFVYGIMIFKRGQIIFSERKNYKKVKYLHSTILHKHLPLSWVFPTNDQFYTLYYSTAFSEFLHLFLYFFKNVQYNLLKLLLHFKFQATLELL